MAIAFSASADEPLLGGFVSAVSPESAAIRLETRDPDPKPEPVPASIAIEGGRLLSNAIWDSAATNFVLNTVVIPSGVTLTVVTNAYVHFTPYTGIKVEPGGALRCVGSQEGPVVFAAANDGDYTINFVSGGTFTDTWTAFRNMNYGGFGTASLDGSLVVDSDEGVMRIPVYISGSRTSTFSVDWEGSDGTTGTIVWNNANEGKKWIELPIEGRAEGFSLRLVEGRGINISGTAHEIAVKVFTSAAPKAVCAESAESAAVRFECRAEGTLGRALVYGTEYIAADGETRAVAWDSMAVADGWQANGTLVRNSQSIAIECGRLPSDATWSNDVTHLVRSWVVVPSGVTLRIEAGTVVKFAELTGFKVEAGGKLIVAGTEVSPVVYTAAADDTIGGDSDLREATPNDGDYAVNIVSGGTYTDSNCAVRYTTFSNLGTATMTANALAALTDGIVRIPVTISTDRTTKFCVDWRTGGARTCAAATGRLTWNSKNDGTKYIELPLVSGAITNGLETFTVELYESQGINISTTARRCNVTVYSNDRFPLGAYAESEESAAVRFETREYDSDLEIEASESIAIEGGRLQANTTWRNNVTHLVRQWVVVPSGVTLTIQAGTVVKFLPYTGIKVEPGGRVNANGTAANNIIFTSVADDTAGGDTDGKEAVPQNGTYSISVISGGTFSTTETQTRYGTSGTFGSLYIMENAVAKKDDGWVKIPVCVSATSSEAFSVDWITDGSRSCASASGRLDWPANSTATKYIEIPLDRMAEAVEDETFTVTLTFTRGINLNQSRKTCLVTLYDTVNALKGVHVGHAESGWAELRMVDNIANTTWPIFAHEEESIAYSTRWVSSYKTPANVQVTIEAPDGQKETVLEEAGQSEGAMAWNTEGLPFGRYTLQHRVTDAEGGQLELLAHDFIVSDAVVHDGAVTSNEIWSASRVHVVRGDIYVKNGVTLAIEAGTIVKFMPGTGLTTEGTGECIANGVIFTHIADDLMGGDTLYDGGLMTPELGAFWFAGNITTDAETEIRYATAKEVSANITADTVWDSHTVYHVTKSIQVRSPATLTIRKGAVVKFADRVSLTVNSGATLNAHGTRAAPIVFTSIKDDTAGGDSNGDGNATEPSNGIWDEICNSGTLNLSYAIVRYCGYGQYSNQGDAAIRNSGGTATLNGCTVEGSDLRLLNCAGGKMEVANTILRDGRWGVVGGNIRFVNGIIADCTTGASGGTAINTIFYGCPTAASGTTVKNCIAFKCDSGTVGMTVADPLFDLKKGDWSVQKGSPCVDAGDEEAAPVSDYFGQTRIGAPDIGLYEVPIRPVPVDVDLVAVSVSAPATAVIGKVVTVSWTIENIGVGKVDDSWRDVVELVDESGAAVELGRHTVSDRLMAGGRLTKSASFRVPSVNPGNVRLRLKVNAERDVPEGSQTDNNVVYSETTIAVTLPSIADDDYSRVTLSAGGSTAVRIPSESGIFAIRLRGGENIGAYAGSGYVPIALRYDVVQIALSDGSRLLVLPKSASENDFNLTLQNGGSASETVNLETLTDSVSLLDAFPSEMSNTGIGYLTLHGIGMDRVVDVKLEGVTTRAAYDVKAVSPGELTATVDMAGAGEGNYIVVLETEDGETVRTTAAISVYKPKKGPKLEARLEIPDTVRQGRIYTGKIIYSNVGDSEMNAPAFKVQASDASVRIDSEDDWTHSSIEVLGVATAYPGGVVYPGETGEIEFEFRSGASPRFRLMCASMENEHTTDWLSLANAATRVNARGRRVVVRSEIQQYADLFADTEMPSAAACGRMIDASTGEPLSGVTIVAMDTAGLALSYDTVDENGVFVLEGLPKSTNLILRVLGGAFADDLPVSMPESGDVRDLIWFGNSGVMVRFALVGCSEETVRKGIDWTAQSNDGWDCMGTFPTNGMMEIMLPQAGNWYIAATAGDGGLAETKLELQSGNAYEDGVLDFRAGNILRGNVFDVSGSILVNACVTLKSIDGVLTQSVKVNEDGSYELRGIRDGSYSVFAEADNCYPGECVRLTVAGGDVSGISLQVYSYEGALVVHVPAALSGGRIVAYENASTCYASTGIDEAGTAVFERIPEGEVTLYVYGSNGKLVSVIMDEPVYGTENEISVDVDTERCFVELLAYGDDGTAASDVIWTLCSPACDGARVVQQGSETAVASVRPGEYVVTAERDGFCPVSFGLVVTGNVSATAVMTRGTPVSIALPDRIDAGSCAVTFVSDGVCTSGAWSEKDGLVLSEGSYTNGAVIRAYAVTGASIYRTLSWQAGNDGTDASAVYEIGKSVIVNVDGWERAMCLTLQLEDGSGTMLVRTIEGGEMRFEALPRIPVMVSIYGEGGNVLARGSLGEDETEISFVLEETISVSGKISGISRAQAVGGIVSFCRGHGDVVATSYLMPDGRFEVEEVSDSFTYLWVRLADGTAFEVSRGDAEHLDYQLTVPDGMGELVVVVRNAKGNPIRNQTVTFTDENGNKLQRRTDKNGKVSTKQKSGKKIEVEDGEKKRTETPTTPNVCPVCGKKPCVCKKDANVCAKCGKNPCICNEVEHEHERDTEVPHEEEPIPQEKLPRIRVKVGAYDFSPEFRGWNLWNFGDDWVEGYDNAISRYLNVASGIHKDPDPKYPSCIARGCDYNARVWMRYLAASQLFYGAVADAMEVLDEAEATSRRHRATLFGQGVLSIGTSFIGGAGGTGARATRYGLAGRYATKEEIRRGTKAAFYSYAKKSGQAGAPMRAQTMWQRFSSRTGGRYETSEFERIMLSERGNLGADIMINVGTDVAMSYLDSGDLGSALTGYFTNGSVYGGYASKLLEAASDSRKANVFGQIGGAIVAPVGIASDHINAINEMNNYIAALYLAMGELGHYLGLLEGAANTPYIECGYNAEYPKVIVVDGGNEVAPYVPPTRDPNEVIGPKGVGEQRFVKPGEEMEYFVYFENASDVDGTVLDIYVTNPLSEWLDWSTFRMGELVFSNQMDHSLEGEQNATREVQQNGTSYFVRNSVALDKQTGVVKVELHIFDKTTKYGDPADPYAGILPPNDETGRGEGHFSFKINVRDDVPAGVVITNSASIVFDFNEPIITDPFWWNTVGVPGAQFASPEVAADEGSNVVVRVSGGSADAAASVKVYLTYNTAAAADVDLAKGTVDGTTPKGGLKFPLTLSWAKGEIGEKVISIPIKADKTVEDDEFFTLQLAEAVGMELGEERVCTVTIRDMNDKTLKTTVTPYKPKKNETVATNSVTVASGNAKGGFVSGTGEYTSGSKLTLTAEPRPGWVFAGWKLNGGDGSILSDKAKWQVVVTNDEDYVAVFEMIPYVRGLADPADGGKVSGSGLCDKGKKVTLKASANKNYTFLGWAMGPVAIDGNQAQSNAIEYIATTPSLVIDRSAKPAANSKTSTTITEIDGDVTYFAVFKSDPKVSVAVEATDESGAEPTGKGAGKYVAGTITGEGKYAPDKKVTLKATANKGYVFAGWDSQSIAIDSNRQQSSIAFEMPSNDVEYVAKFVTADEDKGSIELGVNGADLSGAPTGTPALSTNIWCGVYMEWPVVASALSEPKVKVAGLPAGLKFTEKPVTSKIGSGKTAVVVTNVPANTIYGAPTAASKVNAKTSEVTPSAVKFTVTTAGKSSQTYQIDMMVDALPAWAQGVFAGGGIDGGQGQVSLTVDAKGKISGKVLGEGLTYTLAAPYYSGFEMAEGVSNFLADVTASWSYKEGTKTIKTNDVAQLVVQDNGIGGYSSVDDWFEAYTANWQIEPWKTLGKTFDKKIAAYAILADGSFSEDEEDLAATLGQEVTGFVTLKFSAKGSVTVSGEFVTGYDERKGRYSTVNAKGSATLVPVDNLHGEVFIYLAPAGLDPHVRTLTVPWPEDLL